MSAGLLSVYPVNVKFNMKLKGLTNCQHYDNYDAIILKCHNKKSSNAIKNAKIFV